MDSNHDDEIVNRAVEEDRAAAERARNERPGPDRVAAERVAGERAVEEDRAAARAGTDRASAEENAARMSNPMPQPAAGDVRRDEEIRQRDVAAGQVKAQRTASLADIPLTPFGQADADRVAAERAEMTAKKTFDRSGFTKLGKIAEEMRAKADELTALVARASDVIQDIERDGEVRPTSRAPFQAPDLGARR